jgi:hypothetical protein
MVSQQKEAPFGQLFKCWNAYKLTPLRDLMVDLRFQYYFSNWVDGLNPNPDICTKKLTTG